MIVLLSKIMMDAQTLFGAKRGLISRLARELEITPGAVSQWARVPASRVLDVERITGISRHELRPDIFGAAPASSEAAA